MNPRVFLDSCVLIEGLLASWSASRGVLILGPYRLTFLLAETVIEETKRALARKLGALYGGKRGLLDDFGLLLKRWNVERLPHVTEEEIQEARRWIRHGNDVPVLAAVVRAKPDWLLTTNTVHFDSRVAARTGLRIATPAEFLVQAGQVLPR